MFVFTTHIYNNNNNNNNNNNEYMVRRPQETIPMSGLVIVIITFALNVVVASALMSSLFIMPNSSLKSKINK